MPDTATGDARACAAECPVCGAPNRCQLATAALYKGPCWCGEFTVPAERLRRLPEHARGRCLCRGCLAALALGPDAPPAAGRDFYLDPEQRCVFTARYLLRRGRCCESGCRHCPWKSLVVALLLLILIPAARAQTAVGWSESFDTDPPAAGWEATGDTSLFVWRPSVGELAVTWDSSRPNSYFRRALPVPVTSTNDFHLGFTLRLDAAAGGVHPGRPGPFQIALGLQRRAAADSPGFLRGTGNDSPDLVEWNWFPDTGFGATISPVIVSSAGRFHPAFTFEELMLGTVHRVSMAWDAARRRLRAELDSGGDRVPVVTEVTFPAGAGDFVVDAFAVASYSDAGQTPPEYAGSILAEGAVDDVSVWIAQPRGPALSLARAGNGWRLTWPGWPGWRYRVEATEDFLLWKRLGELTAGPPGMLYHDDAHGAAAARSYRLVCLPE